MTTLYVVRLDAVPGREAELDRWYEAVHLPEVLAIEGFRSAQRFRLAEAQMTPGPAHGWLTLYEIDEDDVAGTLDRLRAATHLLMTDALDPASIDVAVYSSLGPTRLSA